MPKMRIVALSVQKLGWGVVFMHVQILNAEKLKSYFIGSKKLCTTLDHLIQMRLIGLEAILPVIKT